MSKAVLRVRVIFVRFRNDFSHGCRKRFRRVSNACDDNGTRRQPMIYKSCWSPRSACFVSVHVTCCFVFGWISFLDVKSIIKRQLTRTTHTRHRMYLRSERRSFIITLRTECVQIRDLFTRLPTIRRTPGNGSGGNKPPTATRFPYYNRTPVQQSPTRFGIGRDAGWRPPITICARARSKFSYSAERSPDDRLLAGKHGVHIYIYKYVE